MTSLVFFYLASVIILGGGLTVILSSNIIYAALGLMASLIGVAGIFILSFAPFLALVQILIYGGAIVIVIIFALMLTKLEDFRTLSDHKHWPIALIASLVTLGTIIAAAFYTPTNLVSRRGVDFDKIAHELFSQWAIPFEVASLVLLIALMGGVIMVRKTNSRDDK
ncbi:MAG: NADH-quinone oxidoreductase subunit J [Chloroflexi bacterium]|jgi:NADH-quinone oxidoreductase subunit J|nr:MAG: NADH-quinone oxidoreductase subunit J [Chloroflexota bacterium]